LLFTVNTILKFFWDFLLIGQAVVCFPAALSVHNADAHPYFLAIIPGQGQIFLDTPLLESRIEWNVPDDESHEYTIAVTPHGRVVAAGSVAGLQTGEEHGSGRKSCSANYFPVAIDNP
jgi:hypothetical protein